MRKIVLSMATMPLLVAGLSISANADDGLHIFSNTKFSGEIRPRVEVADKDGGTSKAKAMTTRTRLAVSGNFLEVDGLNAKVGITSVNNFGYTNYAPANAKYDLILDPQQAMLSEGFISYTKAKTTLLAGRSFVNLDDQRFIGTVGWRQMERAYDTVTVVDKSVKNLTLLGSWVYGYQGVNSKPTTDTSSLLLNANYTVNSALKLSGFAYMLADIHNTYGIRASGKSKMNNAKLHYALSYAKQTKASLDYSSAANAEIDASYIDVAVGANVKGFIVGAQYEELGKAEGSSTKGFTTPLATLHKFQGFADEFLGQSAKSNNNGLTDICAKIGYAKPGFGKVLAFYHKFNAQTGVTDMGSEMDALYANKITTLPGVHYIVKAAMYKAGATGSGHEADNTKYWAQIDYKF